MNTFLKNDFMKFHFSFMILYIATFLAGWFRGSHPFIYNIHPLLGILSVVVPLIVYITAKNKKLIRQMIKSNFNVKGRTVVKVAKVSTLVIMFYYVCSILTGVLLNNGLYSVPTMYTILSNVHSASKIIVPVAVIAHVVSRVMIKNSRKSS